MAKVKIYNRGKRTWDLKNGIDKDKKAIMVKVHPGRFQDMEKSVAEKLIKNYPKDFIMADDAPSSSGLKKVQAENKSLKAKLEQAKGGLEKLEVLEKENEDLKTELELVKQEFEEYKALTSGDSAKETKPEVK